MGVEHRDGAHADAAREGALDVDAADADEVAEVAGEGLPALGEVPAFAAALARSSQAVLCSPSRSAAVLSVNASVSDWSGLKSGSSLFIQRVLLTGTVRLL